MTSHWGTLPTPPDIEPGIAALEREQMTKLRPMEVEGPKLHQPSSGNQMSSVEPVPAELFAIDNMTAHTIKLIQFTNKMASLITSVRQQRENVKDGEGDVLSFPPTPSIPPFPSCEPKHRLEHHYPFMVRDSESKFVRGFGEAPPEIDAVSKRYLLRRSVAAICAHAGFELCSDSVLESLTDISHEYFLRFTRLLRSAVDNESLNGTAGFQDVMQRVFYDIGIGNPIVLHNFYQTRIVQYRNNLLVKCETLLKEFEFVKSPDYNPEETKSVKVKEEPLSDINFPLNEERLDNEVEEIDETEELLQLAGLSGFDIKLEQDPGTGINSDDADSQIVKTETVDTRLLEAYGDPDSVTEHNPTTPHFSGDITDTLHETSVTSTDIMSPPPISGRPKKNE